MVLLKKKDLRHQGAHFALNADGFSLKCEGDGLARAVRREALDLGDRLGDGERHILQYVKAEVKGGNHALTVREAAGTQIYLSILGIIDRQKAVFRKNTDQLIFSCLAKEREGGVVQKGHIGRAAANDRLAALGIFASCHRGEHRDILPLGAILMEEGLKIDGDYAGNKSEVEDWGRPIIQALQA